MESRHLKTFVAALIPVSIATVLVSCGDSGSNTTGGTITISAPSVVGPNSASPVSSNQPTLTVTNVSVSDGTGATYTFQIATDQGFQSLLRQVTGVGQDGSGQTSWTPDSLASGLYFWRARGVASGTDGPWSVVAQFIVSGPMTGPGETVVVFDSLTNGMTLGEQGGGTLTPQGWRVNRNSNYLRYDVPPISNGYVEWQNVGLAPRGVNDRSFMLLGMWDPSAGDYRENRFRVHLQKLWADPHNPPFVRLRWISQGRIEDVGTNFTNWDPDQVYTWRVDWGPDNGVNRARVFLDGIEITGAQYSRTYSPRRHWIELGIADRNESVIDAVYRNLTIVRRN